MHYSIAFRLSYQLNFNTQIPTTKLNIFRIPFVKKQSWKPSTIKMQVYHKPKHSASNAFPLKSQLV